MKRWLVPLLLTLLLVSCAPLEPQATGPVSTQTQPPPTAAPTLPPAEPTLTPTQSTTATPGIQDEDSSAVDVVRESLAQSLDLEVEDIRVYRVTAVDWPDTCLGIPISGACAERITPGYILTLEVPGENGREFLTFHTNASGEVSYRFPEAALNARQVLIEQTGIPLERIILFGIKGVEWRDSCMGATIPGVNCLDVIVPGYVIIFDADGKQYEYATNQDGSQVVLVAERVIPEGVLLTWSSLNEPCLSIEVSLSDVHYGACGSQLTLAEYYLPQRRMELESYAMLYKSFETETENGVVTFRGVGRVTATPAEMRMLAQWGSQIYTEAAHDSIATPLMMSIRWHKEGNNDGSYENLYIYRTGFAIANHSRDDEQNLICPQLSSHQLEMLFGWIDSLTSFVYTQRYPDVEDAKFISLEFSGQGTQTAEDDVLQAILDLVAELFLQAQVPPNPAAQALAQVALTDYLAALSAGDYTAVSALYGGSYEIMIDHNPALDPVDHSALFEAACRINGAVCNLSLRSVVHVAGLGEGAYRFTVELENPRGELFELGPCCEELPVSTPPQTQFSLLVQWVDGRYLVMTLPIYAG